MPTTKNQPAYRNATTQTDDIADLLLATVTIGAVTADAGTSLLVFNDGVNDVFASSAAPLPVTATGTVAATQSGTWTVTGAGGTFPVTGTFWQATQPVSGTVTANLAAGTNNIGDVDVLTFGGQTPALNSGLVTAGTQRVTIATNDLVSSTALTMVLTVNTPGSNADNAMAVQGVAGMVPVDVAITSALPAGTNNIGDVDVLTVPTDPFGANADAASATGSISAKLRFIAATGIPITGTVTVGSHAVTNAGTFATQDDARTTGGESSYSFLSTAAVQAAEIKGSAGTVYSMQFFNKNAAAMYVRLYNQTGAPASGDTANIVWRGMIPGNTAGTGYVVQFPKGKAFATGIGIRVSGAIADNDTTVLGANEVMGNVGFK
jgi:hypothetical protein